MDNQNSEEKKLTVFSEKTGEIIDFTLNDEHLSNENYECIGLSNADYGS